MTTKSAGGKITGLLALTVEAQEALDVGDVVHLVGDYEVEIADATKRTLGVVTVANKGRVSSVMGTSVGNPVVPGDVTVDVPGFMVRTMTLGGTVAAGDPVGLNGAGEAITVAAGHISEFGIALTGGDDGDLADVLWT